MFDFGFDESGAACEDCPKGGVPAYIIIISTNIMTLKGRF